MISTNLLDIIKTTLACHPKECVFVPNAQEAICQHVANGLRFIDARDKNQVVDLIFEAVLANELYCPHEGIDRR